MRRPHPYAAIALVALALVLATLAMSVRCETVPVGPRARPFDVDVIPYINGHAIYPGSETCAPRGSGGYVPTVARVRQIREAVVLVLATDIETGALTTPLLYVEWRAAFAASSEYLPHFTDRPTWVMGAVPPGWASNCVNAQGEPRLCICSAGIGYLSPVVDTSDPARVEPLCGWEYLNSLLGVLRRGDAWDSAYVASANNRVAGIVGGWKQE